MEIKHPLLDRLLPGINEIELTTDSLALMEQLASAAEYSWFDKRIKQPVGVSLGINGTVVTIAPDDLDFLDIVVSLEDLNSDLLYGHKSKKEYIETCLNEMYVFLNVVGTEQGPVTVNTTAYMVLAILLSSVRPEFRTDLEF